MPKELLEKGASKHRGGQDPCKLLQGKRCAAGRGIAHLQVSLISGTSFTQLFVVSTKTRHEDGSLKVKVSPNLCAQEAEILLVMLQSTSWPCDRLTKVLMTLAKRDQ